MTLKALSPGVAIDEHDWRPTHWMSTPTAGGLIAIAGATTESTCGITANTVIMDSMVEMPTASEHDPWRNSLLKTLIEDTSEYAIRPADPAILVEMVDGLEQARMGAKCDNTTAQDNSCMRSWERFTKLRGTPKWRLLDRNSMTFDQKYRENVLQADFVI